MKSLHFSNGSACTTSSYKPSHVLLAMGLSEDGGACSVRLSWGSGTKDFDPTRLVTIIESLRELQLGFFTLSSVPHYAARCLGMSYDFTTGVGYAQA